MASWSGFLHFLCLVTFTSFLIFLCLNISLAIPLFWHVDWAKVNLDLRSWCGSAQVAMLVIWPPRWNLGRHMVAAWRLSQMLGSCCCQTPDRMISRLAHASTSTSYVISCSSSWNMSWNLTTCPSRGISDLDQTYRFCYRTAGHRLSTWVDVPSGSYQKPMGSAADFHLVSKPLFLSCFWVDSISPSAWKDCHTISKWWAATAQVMPPRNWMNLEPICDSFPIFQLMQL